MTRIPSGTIRNCRRRGLAPLELIMFLPLLTLIIALILYIGKTTITQLEFANTLRNETWNYRNTSELSKNTILHQEDLTKTDVNVLNYEKSVQGEIGSNEMSETIKTSLIYDKWQHSTNSIHQIYDGSWDEGSANVEQNKIYTRRTKGQISSDPDIGNLSDIWSIPTKKELYNTSQ